METTESMVRDDADELGDDPKEFLFPCAQDHYTLSDSIKEDPVTGMISGERAPSEQCCQMAKF